ncbi:MAG: hypothetical protein IKI20_03330 [Lachnospiraceae bacterium]|nr:hypothetical protein [Lachnospiraceae bacterium]
MDNNSFGGGFEKDGNGYGGYNDYGNSQDGNYRSGYDREFGNGNVGNYGNDYGGNYGNSQGGNYGNNYGGGYGNDFGDSYKESFYSSVYGSSTDDIYYGDKQFPSRRLYKDSEDEFKRCPGKEIVGLIMGIVCLIDGVILMFVSIGIRSVISRYKTIYSSFGAYSYKPDYSGYKFSLFLYGAFTIALFIVVGNLKRRVYDQADIVTKKIDTGFTLSIIGAAVALIAMIVGISA